MTNPWLFCDYKGIAQANTCNPLSWTFNTTGYNMMNVDNPYSAMIPLLDQAFWHQQAMSGMYMTTQMNLGFGCGMDSVFNTLLNKSVYDVGKMYQANGNYPNVGGNIWTNMGYFRNVQSNNNDNDNGNSDNDDNNDDIVVDTTKSVYEPKFNDFATYVKKIIDKDTELKNDGEAGFLSTEKAVAIKNALDAEEGTFETRYNNLVNAYKAVSEDTIKQRLLDYEFTFKVKDQENELNARLLKTGYEFKNLGADEFIDLLSTEIDNIATDTGVGQSADNVIAHIKAEEIKILDLISSWNSSGKDKKLMDIIIEKYNTVETNGAKLQVKDQAITPITDALLKEARTVKDSLKDKTLKEAIEIAMKALEASKKNVGSSLSADFEKLYVYTRLGATQVLEEQLTEKFGKYDDRVFKVGMFTDKVKEDLSEEGHQAVLDNAAVIANAASGNEEAKAKAEEVLALNNVTDIVNFNKNQNTDGSRTTTDEPQAWKNGENIATMLAAHTGTKQADAVYKLIINETNEKNVFVTLAGYEDNDGMIRNLLVHLAARGEDEQGSKEKAQKLIKHILTCVKGNLEAQKLYNESKGISNKDIENHIKMIEDMLKKDTIDKKDAKKIHNEILENYIEETHKAYETNSGFCEFFEGIGNGVGNVFRWFGDKVHREKTKKETGTTK